MHGEAHKECRACKQHKPRSQFYQHKAMGDGLLSYCKDCVKARVRRYRASNIDRIREYDRERSCLPHRVAKRLEIYRAYTVNTPERKKAHTAVGNAVRDGRLVKTPCAFCGATEALEAHHHDYALPLDVTWLCKPCHRKFHGLERMSAYERAA